MRATTPPDVINAAADPRIAYATDVEGGRPVARRYAIAGRLQAASYARFLAERAAWFGLSGWVAADGESAVQLLVAGPEALVGALEMAATLGPLDALVETLESRPEPGAVPPDFTIRR